MKQLLSPLTLVCVMTLLFWTCKEKAIKHNSGPIAVDFYLNKASFAYLKNKRLYLQNTRTKKIIDSLRISGNKSQFLVDASVHDVSFTYRIFFLDSAYDMTTGRGGIIQKILGYHNPFYKNILPASFYIEPEMKPLYMYLFALDTKEGKKELPNEFADFSTAHKSIGPQNDVVHKNIVLSFTKTKNADHLKYTKRSIEKYPYSFALLDQLYQQTGSLSKEEMTSLLSLFDETVKSSTLYQLLKGYIDNKEAYDQSFPFSVCLKNQDHTIKEMGTEKAKYHLIIFWAWWCKPCREEIPSLKELYQQKKDLGLKIQHISIDGDVQKWNEALMQEKMPWEQYIVDESSYTKLLTMYDLKLIPKSYLFDSSYKLIRSFTGFDTQSFQALTNSLK